MEKLDINSSEGIIYITDIFSKEEIEILYENIKANKSESTDEYGRIRYALMSNSVSQKIFDKLHNVIKKVTDIPLQISNVTYVEYNLLYGKPNLPAHVDRDSTELILNIQLESNTNWDLGLNFKTYSLVDNSALVFNPNKEIHWRVHKEFKDGEYVRMLFVRFSNQEKPSDYSYLPHHPDNEMFKEYKTLYLDFLAEYQSIATEMKSIEKLNREMKRRIVKITDKNEQQCE